MLCSGFLYCTSLRKRSQTLPRPPQDNTTRGHLRPDEGVSLQQPSHAVGQLACMKGSTCHLNSKLLLKGSTGLTAAGSRGQVNLRPNERAAPAMPRQSEELPGNFRGRRVSGELQGTAGSSQELPGIAGASGPSAPPGLATRPGPSHRSWPSAGGTRASRLPSRRPLFGDSWSSPNPKLTMFCGANIGKGESFSWRGGGALLLVLKRAV